MLWHWSRRSFSVGKRCSFARADDHDRLDGRVHGLPSLPHARQLQNLSAGALVVGVSRRPVGRRLGADLGGEPSQASSLQRQGRRSAFAARRRHGGPHAVVHAELRPTLAQGARREVRAGYHERQNDGGHSPSVSAVAHCARASSCSSSASSARRSAWAAGGPGCRWSSGASACGWCTCCTSPG